MHEIDLINDRHALAPLIEMLGFDAMSAASQLGGTDEQIMECSREVVKNVLLAMLAGRCTLAVQTDERGTPCDYTITWDTGDVTPTPEYQAKRGPFSSQRGQPMLPAQFVPTLPQSTVGYL
jgi:hypothetical protein